MDDFIRRRVEFLLTEARVNASRDQVITFAMRVLSNHASVGRDAQSSTIKKLNKRVSQRAFIELDRVDRFEEWTKNTRNEHQKPLKETWLWLLENSNNLTAEKVWEHFNNHPMTTILKAEDDDLNKLKLRSSSDVSRYSTAGITELILDVTPIDHFKNQLLLQRR